MEFKEAHGDNVDVADITWIEADNTFAWSNIVGAGYTYSAMGKVITSNQYVGLLEFIWVMEGYIVSSRRQEQNFQISGEVDDASAVSIGKILGANAVVTVNIDGTGDMRRLRLRALDTQTSQVIGAASERLQ